MALLDPGGRRILAVLAVVFVISLPAVTPRIYASDEIEFYSFLRSIWFDRDLSFDNEYQYFYETGIALDPGFHETFLERTTETGLRLNFGTIGPAILWSPFYAVADALTRAAGGALGPVDGYARPYVAAVAYGSALYGFLAIVLSVAAARRLLRPGPGPLGDGVAALIVWIGTPLLFYMYIAPPMSHAPSAFAVSAFILSWLVVRERWSLRGALGLGALAGLMAMVREQDAFFVAGPALDYVMTMRRRAMSEGSGPVLREALTRVAAAGAAFAVVYLPQAVAYIVLNGRLGPSGIVARKMNWFAPYAVHVLLSPSHGFFFWTPLAVLALAGLVWLVFSARTMGRPDEARIAACMLVMVAFQVYVTGSVESWTLAGAFGQRRFVALTPLLVIGLAAGIRLVSSTRIRAAMAVPVLLGVWWNLGLILQFGTMMMDRQRLDLAEIAYNNFVVVPRHVPGLAYRYAFERDSFYRPRQSDR